jgi:hypothetical protein
MHQIISTIKERSFFIIVLLFLLNLSCEQNQQTKLKQQEPKRTQNRFNADLEKVNNFDDLAKHLNDYKSVWKSMGINWDYINDVALSFSRWEKSGKLKNISSTHILAIINDLPTQGDLRGIVFDLWKEYQGKTMTK